MEHLIKKQRIDIDYIRRLGLYTFENYMPAQGSNFQEAMKELYLAKMFLGKVLGTIKDNRTPYPFSMEAGNQIIEQEADTYPDNVKFPKDFTYTDCIKELRRLIDEQVKKFDLSKGYESVKRMIYDKEYFISLTKAKLFFGAELGRIRDGRILAEAGLIPTLHSGCGKYKEEILKRNVVEAENPQTDCVKESLTGKARY